MDKQALWAPWRMGYIRTLVTEEKQQGFGRERGCFLCEASSPDLTPDAVCDRLILARDEHAVLLLNRYPYANGHLLVAPLLHVPPIRVDRFAKVPPYRFAPVRAAGVHKCKRP